MIPCACAERWRAPAPSQIDGTESFVRRRCINVLGKICQIMCTSVVIYIFASPIVVAAHMTTQLDELTAGGSNAPNPTRSHFAKTPTRYFSHTCFLARALCMS